VQTKLHAPLVAVGRTDEQRRQTALVIALHAAEDEAVRAPALHLEPIPRPFARVIARRDALRHNPFEAVLVRRQKKRGTLANDVLYSRRGVVQRAFERVLSLNQWSVA